MPKLILLRHGESVWNKENFFTGWIDVDLSDRGVEEAHEAARLIVEAGIIPDIAFTSYLKRAIKTLDIVLSDMVLKNIPVFSSWRLNERHYGALQGLNKSQLAVEKGEDQVKVWRRSYTVRPPALTEGESGDSIYDPKYRDLDRKDIPLAESLEDTTKRLMPYWDDVIFPEIKKGRNVLLAGHGSGVRSIVKYLDELTEEEVMSLDIPTGMPLVYEFKDDGSQIGHYYLGNQEEVNKKIEAVKFQGKIK